jgi:hypothetical protein
MSDPLIWDIRPAETPFLQFSPHKNALRTVARFMGGSAHVEQLNRRLRHRVLSVRHEWSESPLWLP